MNSKAHNLEI